MGMDAVGNPRVQLGDLGDNRLERRNQAEHDCPPGLSLHGAETADRCGAQPPQQLDGRASARVAVSLQEGRQALLSKATCIRRGGIATQEGERDPGVDGREDPRRARPKAIQLRSQLVGETNSAPHHVLARSGQRPQRLGLIGVPAQDPQAVEVGARQLRQAKGVEAIGLAAGDLIARPRGRQLVGMDRQDGKAGLHQALDEQALRALDRDPADAKGAHPCDQLTQPFLGVREKRPLQRRPIAVDDAKGVLFACPVDPA